MKEIKTTNRFLRDLKLARKRGKDLTKIESVIDTLAQGNKLSPKHRPHRLHGDMKGFWECHIEPDWLLIWADTDEAITLIRSGTHADLFEELWAHHAMNIIINSKELRAALPKLVERVRKGARFTVIYRSRPAFQMVPVDESETPRIALEADPLYRARAVGRSTDFRSAAEHDAILYAK